MTSRCGALIALAMVASVAGEKCSRGSCGFASDARSLMQTGRMQSAEVREELADDKLKVQPHGSGGQQQVDKKARPEFGKSVKPKNFAEDIRRRFPRRDANGKAIDSDMSVAHHDVEKKARPEFGKSVKPPNFAEDIRQRFPRRDAKALVDVTGTGDTEMPAPHDPTLGFVTPTGAGTGFDPPSQPRRHRPQRRNAIALGRVNLDAINWTLPLPESPSPPSDELRRGLATRFRDLQLAETSPPAGTAVQLHAVDGCPDLDLGLIVMRGETHDPPRSGDDITVELYSSAGGELLGIVQCEPRERAYACGDLTVAGTRVDVGGSFEECVVSAAAQLSLAISGVDSE
eukprot:CAMPEP_0176090654 /NCGR_PEP_ID=MMETSP0120_2-20121206/45401_1 /TAXON_ID=160619 /ORGANISM="Kryptoperidinium foliaceum, Strain CCMP 1326" /LENGTH=343 /DNA_ID=CAMNT_0017424535 /DNA_START=40 /DNA_END=1072 /DNA_ORIENTATION=+